MANPNAVKLEAVMSDVPSNRPHVIAWAPKQRAKRCVVALDMAMYLGVKPRATTEYGWMRHLTNVEDVDLKRDAQANWVLTMRLGRRTPLPWRFAGDGPFGVFAKSTWYRL